MDPGIVALGAIFALAGALLAWSVARGRAIARRLLEAGFVACDDDAPVLLRALSELAGGHPPAVRRVYEVGRCFKRAAGWGMLYRFGVTDKTHADTDGIHESAPTGGRVDVYLLDLRDPERVARGPVSVYLAPSAPGPLQRLLAGLVKSDPHGVPLELDGPHAGAFLAAFSDRPGKLGDLLPAETQQRLAKGVDQGFHAAHFGAGKLALEVQHDRPDVDRQLAYLAEWA
ncbi:MAG TPA: hypothetical protein VLL75_02905 [Vicinamibacteria bacterium]|nr:hypothetical protein [Vicinamibacteria bacterium]